MMPGERYYTEEVKLTSGDRLVLYTDGLTENPDAELIPLVMEHFNLSAQHLTEAIVASMLPAGQPLDDVTILVVAIN
jgi:serine phosphatase RsbU (regulator of sigma subunit)